MSQGRVTSMQFDHGNRVQGWSEGSPPGRAMRRFDQPPEGVCALMQCRTPAAMWVGRVQPDRRGGTITVAVGVCQEHFDALSSGQLDAATVGMIAP